MTTDTMFAVFADFNDREHEPPPAVEEAPPAVDELGQIRAEAWTDGYMTGRQEPVGQSRESCLAAKLVASLHDMDAKAADAVDAASLAVADLLVNTVIAVASDDWPAKLLSRVRMVADRIKPALAVEPEFVLRDDGGSERRFADIDSLSRALDDGLVGEDVTIRWQRGEATISRTALLEDLRAAVIPLSAGLADTQETVHPS
ncbi:MAG TPA: hypothetical protein VHU42_08995 [Rhodopila sp.]|nr:hypothetical protein [Rhodopila sp.]